MKANLTLLLALGASLLPPSRCAATDKEWHLEVSAYALAAGLSGDVTVRGITSDLDVGFDEIWDNLEFSAMGKVRIEHGKWAVTTDVIYMSLGASKDNVSIDFDQWVVEPSLSYEVCTGFEVLAGARYNNLSGTVRGPFGINPTGTQEWWDPIVGANAALPLSERLSLVVRGDVGGFDVGSDLTWQAFPYLNWHLCKSASIHVGYRWVYTDYSTGSGLNRFRYDVMTQGPQVGFSFRF